MDLDEFIKQSIVDICHGIKNARDEIHEEMNNFPIAPAFIDGKRHFDKLLEKIEFDICVTTTEEGSRKVGGGANIKVVSIGASGENKTIKENVSRIKFSIPFYPAALVPKIKS